MKKLFLASLLALLSLCANAYDFEENGLYYNITGDNTVEVTYKDQYSGGYIGDIIIPNSVTYNSKVYNVTSIGERAFNWCLSLTSVKIPTNVTSIGEEAFVFCINLSSINIPENVTNIDGNAFEICLNLASITVASDNKVYDSRNNCNAIIRTTDNTLIQGCSSTVIPDDVKCIVGGAFSDTNITTIHIPASVLYIEGCPFSNCSNLTSITVANDNEMYDSRNNCNAIIRKYDNTLIQGCNGSVIPDGVTSIGNYAFHGCNIKSIDLPTSVTSIGEYAFYVCNKLTLVNISESVTNIGGHAFFGCSNLTEIDIPESVTYIGHSAFDNCSGLTSINIPANITTIEDYTFSSCSNLTSIKIPENVTSIGQNAFMGCSNLTSINIPENVTNIGVSAFSGCESLANIYCYGSVPAEIVSYTFDEDTYNKYTLHVPYGTTETYKATEWGKFINIVEFDPTDVKTVSAGDKTAKELRIYDLNGVRMAAPQRGLNIINGKKVIF